jgi:serine/threonine-protein kinase
VYFQMIWPWTEPDSTRPLGESASERISRWVTLVIIGTILVAASWIGWRNWQLGRGDLRGASRLAGFVVCGQLIAWVLTVPHTLTPEEYGRVSWGLASALLSGAASWVLYVALEPYVRRRWPQSLISWSRLLGGGWRDPLVAGHLLIGVGVGIGYTLLFYTRSYLQAGYHQFQLSTLLDPLHRGGAVVGMTVNAAAVAMALFFLYFLFRVFLRNPVLAGAANVAVFALLAAVGSNPPWIGGVETGLVSLGAILILTRFGLLPMIVGIIVSSILPGFPMTTDFSAWYAGSTMFSIATVLALTAYAFHTARAGRPLFSGGALDR